MEFYCVSTHHRNLSSRIHVARVCHWGIDRMKWRAVTNFQLKSRTEFSARSLALSILYAQIFNCVLLEKFYDLVYLFAFSSFFNKTWRWCFRRIAERQTWNRFSLVSHRIRCHRRWWQTFQTHSHTQRRVHLFCHSAFFSQHFPRFFFTFFETTILLFAQHFWAISHFSPVNRNNFSKWAQNDETTYDFATRHSTTTTICMHFEMVASRDTSIRLFIWKCSPSPSIMAKKIPKIWSRKELLDYASFPRFSLLKDVPAQKVFLFCVVSILIISSLFIRVHDIFNILEFVG